LNMVRSRGAVLNPNGIPSFSPRLRAERYPGSTSQTRPNPERVASNPRRSIAKRFSPFRVDNSFSRVPRVARASQPWADGCNPVGIEKARRCGETRNQSKDAANNSPSPLNGERAGVRGGNAVRVRDCESRRRHHPSPSFPLPVEGRGRPEPCLRLDSSTTLTP
jgi:hypothetical protein